MPPCISVIIRLYNGIEYLNETIDSVISQQYDEWELMIGVNGHGSDGGDVFRQALAIVESKGDPRIQVKNYPDVRGGAQALNALAADAKYEWVAILDADDKWHPLKLLNQVYMINHIVPQPDVIGTHCEYFGEQTGRPSLPSGYINTNVFREYNPIINSSVIMRKSLVDFMDFYNLDDYDLWCRLSLQGCIFFNLPDRVTYHRIHSDSHYNASKKQDPDALRNYYFGGKN